MWKLDARGMFSTKSFCKVVEDATLSPSLFSEEVWNGASPPKAQLLCWQVLKGKMAVKVNINALCLYLNALNAIYVK